MCVQLRGQILTKYLLCTNAVFGPGFGVLGKEVEELGGKLPGWLSKSELLSLSNSHQIFKTWNVGSLKHEIL